METKYVALPGSFMAASLVGFWLSFNMFGTYPSWSFAFMLVFVIMFIASMISLTKAPIDAHEEEK